MGTFFCAVVSKDMNHIEKNYFNGRFSNLPVLSSGYPNSASEVVDIQNGCLFLMLNQQHGSTALQTAMHYKL